MKRRIALLLVGLVLGMAALGLAIPNTNAQTVTILYSFANTPTNGSRPYAGLIQGSDGDFYGTTEFGGTTNQDFLGNYGYGVVFRISTNGSETNLYRFAGPPNDGSYPLAGLIQGGDGSFYGTTSNLYGTVFRINPSGDYTNLHIFSGSPGDGLYPSAGLVQGTDGNFYGTTGGGGTSTNCFQGCGTVFRISPNGNYTNLYSFAGSPTDGIEPHAVLVQGADGNFYGTTMFGGISSNGTVFRISPSGNYTNLYSFIGNANDGAYPIGGLVRGTDGNFYGTTSYGGPYSYYGAVFRISPSGSYTNLHFFVGAPADGATPIAGLVQGSDGNFYGTTVSGGINSKGIIFRINPNGSYTNLHNFVGRPSDGAAPTGRLVQSSDGNFYGTTTQGGISTNCPFVGCGTVFRLTIPLNPPANQITGMQLSGTNIVLAIPSVAYETYQLQFSSSMTPTNWVNVPGLSITNSIGALLTLTNFGGALQPQGFYRFDITP